MAFLKSSGELFEISSCESIDRTDTNAARPMLIIPFLTKLLNLDDLVFSSWNQLQLNAWKLQIC